MMSTTYTGGTRSELTVFGVIFLIHISVPRNQAELEANRWPGPNYLFVSAYQLGAPVESFWDLDFEENCPRTGPYRVGGSATGVGL